MDSPGDVGVLEDFLYLLQVRMIVDLLQIGLALTLPVLLILAVARRRQRDAERADAEGAPSNDAESGVPTAMPAAPPGRTLRRLGGGSRENTIDLGQDRELARTLIAALETRGVRVKLSERRGGGPNGGPTFEVRYNPEDEATVRSELQRAFDID